MNPPLNRTVIPTLAALGLGLLPLAPALAQSPSAATGTPPQSKGLLEVSHQRHDYRDPVLQIDLTLEGPAGWIYFGSDETKKNPMIIRKAGVLPLIGEPRLLAGTNRVYKDNRPLRFNFFGGTPTEKLADSQVGWWFRHADAHGAGLEIPLAADTRERVAKVYLGYWNGTGRFRARLSDDSAPPFEETVKKAGWENRVYTLRYRAGATDQKLILSFECLGAGIKDGNVEFLAVAIRNAADPPLAETASVPASGPRAWARAPVVPNKIKDACEPVGYANQRLDPTSYLGRRVDINFHTGLLKTFSVADYLASYGTNPKWPTGEYLGKIMQGLSRMYLYSGDRAALARLEQVVAEWHRLQDDTGWLGTTGRFKSWDIWEHKYVLLGLVDYYALTGDEQALKMARKIGDLYCATIGPGLGDINQSGHWALGSASILEPMTYLYRYTGEPRYLRFCEYIVDSFESPTGPKLISILTTGSRRVCEIEDPFATRAAREVNFKGKGQVRNRSKGYEMLSCIIGLVRMYQLTGKQEYLDVAVNAWQDIAEKRLYLAGSSGADECFKDDHCLPAEASDAPAEGCVTAHWIFLSRVLFEVTGEPRYTDGIEIALYNYLLASQRPQDCYQSYNTGMNGAKTFQKHDVRGAVGKAPCCLTSVMREIARTPEAVWTRFASGGLGVVLYTAGSIEDTIQTQSGPLPVHVTMDTDFPASGRVTLRVQPRKPAHFRLALRVPGWAKDFTATVAGQKRSGTPGQFLDLEREWKDGDTVTITMDLNERLVPGGASYPGHFAFMRGPQVLTLVAGKGAEGRLAGARVKADIIPALQPMGDFLPTGWIGGQAYRSPALAGAEGCALAPFGDAGQPGLPLQFRTWIALEPGTGVPAPSAASALQATALAGNRTELSWQGAGRHADGWRIERKRADVGLWFHVKTTASGVTRCVDDSVNVVLPGKTYTYRVAAFNAGGLSAYSSNVTVTTPAVAVPSAPKNLKATVVSPTQINLTWTDTSDNEDGFKLECRAGEGAEWKPVMGRTPANWPSFTDYGLDPGRTYAYRVRAFNTAGESAWSDEATATTGDR